jgi:hypothetical protein
MEIINGIASKVKITAIATSGSNYTCTLELNGKTVIIKSIEPITISENDQIRIAGTNSDSGFKGLAYRNITTNITGNNGSVLITITGIIFSIFSFGFLSVFLYMAYFANPDTHPPVIFSCVFISFICIFIIVGLSITFRGIRLFQARNLVKSS